MLVAPGNPAFGLGALAVGALLVVLDAIQFPLSPDAPIMPDHDFLRFGYGASFEPAQKGALIYSRYLCDLCG